MMDLIISGEFNDYLSRASQRGWLHALSLSSLTGQYGIFSRLHRFKELKLEGLMEATLVEIRDGDFAIEWFARVRARLSAAGEPAASA